MRPAIPIKLLQPVLLISFYLNGETGRAQHPSNEPKALQPPGGEALISRLRGKGNQIYVCQDAGGLNAWTLKGPDAKLFSENGKLAGRHFAGPTWEANDGSRVKGKVVANVPSPDTGSIPWLLLTVTMSDGTGIMTHVHYIQRLETKGGVAPSEPCSGRNEKQEVAVPYEATYYFYGKPLQ